MSELCIVSKNLLLFSRECIERRKFERKHASTENLYKCKREKPKKTGKQRERKNANALLKRRIRGRDFHC